jgi:hypothetical protein
MRSSGFSHSPFATRDPVRAAEEDIRRYLIRRGVIAPPEPGSGEPRTALCLLAIYVAIALVVVLASLLLARLECDPLFSDRGLTVACRNRPGELAKIIGPAGNGYSSFMPANMQP